MTTQSRLRFGVFMAPYHRFNDNPTLALRRDLELIRWLDELGFEEAWIGEHHSAGIETIASPEIFIAAAAQQTRTIRFGTGVISLPYHHPLNVADRMVLLDHLTQGRAMLGVGPGALPSDFDAFGIERSRTRPMMEESLGVILRLLRGETVDHDAGWFTLRKHRLQMLPWTQPCFDIVVSSVNTPSGPTLAGRHGTGMLTIGSNTFGTVSDYAGQWRRAEEVAAQHGNVMDRRRWRVSIPIHIAETRAQAFDDIREGFRAHVHDYMRGTVFGGLPTPLDFDDDIERIAGAGQAIVGTPEDAIAAVAEMLATSGGFGALLAMHYDWTTREKSRYSYELWARYVAPHFQGLLAAPNASAAAARAIAPAVVADLERAMAAPAAAATT